MRIFSYVLKEDSGFAPNPFWNFCTLACCKPKIRQSAQVGDWVVGTGSVNNVGSGKLVYAMKVTEKIDFVKYSKDAHFSKKIPSSGKIEMRGDNIYFKGQEEKWKQKKSLHCEKDMKRDLSSEYVLISDYFFYFGSNAILIPEQFR